MYIRAECALKYFYQQTVTVGEVHLAMLDENRLTDRCTPPGRPLGIVHERKARQNTCMNALKICINIPRIFTTETGGTKKPLESSFTSGMRANVFRIFIYIFFTFAN